MLKHVHSDQESRTTIDRYRLSVTEQSNDVLKQVVIANEIYPHIVRRQV